MKKPMISSEILIELHTQNAIMMAENKRLREALKPFANWSSSISLSDIERAQELLRNEDEH